MSFTNLVTWVTIYCYKCGAAFAVPTEVDEEWHARGQSFYCPNGHSQHYTMSLEKKLQQARDQLTRERAYHDQTRADLESKKHQLRATKGVVTKIKRRVGKGVCPCCNRTFPNLTKHMDTKHPDWSSE